MWQHLTEGLSISTIGTMGPIIPWYMNWRLGETRVSTLHVLGKKTSSFVSNSSSPIALVVKMELLPMAQNLRLSALVYKIFGPVQVPFTCLLWCVKAVSLCCLGTIRYIMPWPPQDGLKWQIDRDNAKWSLKTRWFVSADVELSLRDDSLDLTLVRGDC